MNSAREDLPCALQNEDERQRRLGMLHQPHMHPLTSFVESLRAARPDCKIPNFDPCDGGVRAKALFLLEAPASGAMRTGFISRNNPDLTARNFCELFQHASIARDDVLIWNIVPWPVNGNRPINREDIAEAAPFTKKLLSLLPELKIIVLCGRKVQAGAPQIRELTSLPIVGTYLPSQRVFNRWPDAKSQTQEKFVEIAARLR